MTTRVFPSSRGVPEYAEQGSLNEKPMPNLDTFKPQFGPPKTHRATSVPCFSVSFDTPMNSDQYDALVAWWMEDLLDGSLPFTMLHPRTGVRKRFIFVDDQPPEMSDKGFDRYVVKFELIQVP